ncbi:MAG: hypothetical protein HRF44_10160 [Ignavibacterium sp.]|jgi:mono/diheme cytochrome c family protein
MRLFVLIPFLLIGGIMILMAPARGPEPTDAAGEKLFRQRCLRCHDLRMATRPIRPDAADSLVQAMRRYDTRWIKDREAPVLADYLRAYHTRRHLRIHSHTNNKE